LSSVKFQNIHYHKVTILHRRNVIKQLHREQPNTDGKSSYCVLRTEPIELLQNSI